MPNPTENYKFPLFLKLNSDMFLGFIGNIFDDKFIHGYRR